MTEMKKTISKKAIIHLDENHDFYCSRSSLHFKVWMICGIALTTASYDVFCIFLLVRLIGRNKFQDDPFFTQSTVAPGVMPIGTLGILLTITFIGAMISQLVLVPWADKFGRKVVFEISLLTTFVASILSAISFFRLQSDASGQNVVGSLIFWRFFLGLGVGGIYPLTAIMMAEYSSKFSRGAYLSLVFASQGLGILGACLITLIASSSINFAYPANDFPIEIRGCASFQFLTSNNDSPCPLDIQQTYAAQVMGAAPNEIEFIWRSVVATGSLGALFSLIFSRLFLVETPRFTAHVLGDHQKAVEDLAKQCEIDYTMEVQSAIGRDPEDVMDADLPSKMSAFQFVTKYFSRIFLASSGWLIFNIVFFGLIILIDQPAKVIGLNKGNFWQNAAEECLGLAAAYLTLFLVALIPGFYVTVLTVDVMGRKIIQFFGFIVMAIWCSSCSGSYRFLTHPNKNMDEKVNMDGPKSNYLVQASGWMVMFGLTFFFASWGPATTTYIIPAELFPTKWRVTGYSLCAAAGSLGSIAGVWLFTFLSQPFPKETTFAYPCSQTEYPSDFLPFFNNACREYNYCPAGRGIDSARNNGAVGTICDTCLPNSNAGCYPFGLGLTGSMAIMVPILAIGATFTMLIPLTDYKALEELTLENVELDKETSDEEINLEMIELQQNYDDEDLEKKEKLSSKRLSPAEIFAEKATVARAVAATSRAEEEARVLDAVIAADTLADGQARMERTDAARKAAANARFEMEARAARSAQTEEKSSTEQNSV
mmetsp:Transcript_2448/g.2556  ORF Transcript_2448/g.2556 Transcript_2448/m.2556 type:complete len:767 (+) Transcript_2448:215-2515(+)|eukprot:CAMPEP_0119039416 /NCGR_PEP_ID=MMETSP1177-20130426/8862_1 /TAXON_ID=2985 /ORGANISM="Ochromonas sp, Strain CCMP1899" /LENGTH=766 /DNA_ID=CAMNT_0007003237 /DNA_START=195 /DNA_END=2495 /DNA_ORIENTATION=-